MDIRKFRTCENCRTSVPLDQVRIYPLTKDKTILMCEKCVAQLKQKSAGQGLKGHAPMVERSDFIQYHCRRCNYSFRADKFKAGVMYRLHCPYCGRTDTLDKK